MCDDEFQIKDKIYMNHNLHIENYLRKVHKKYTLKCQWSCVVYILASMQHWCILCVCIIAAWRPWGILKVHVYLNCWSLNGCIGLSFSAAQVVITLNEKRGRVIVCERFPFSCTLSWFFFVLLIQVNLQDVKMKNIL